MFNGVPNKNMLRVDVRQGELVFVEIEFKNTEDV